MERNEGARLIGWTMGPGCLSGLVAAVLAAASIALSDDSWSSFLGVVVIGGFYGAPAGALAGFVIGVPVALMTGVARRHTDYWRVLGAVLTAATAGAIMVAAVGLLPLPTLVIAGLAAVSAWWGLGRIFEPSPVPEWLRTPSAHSEG